ncbi:ABC transporter ATP-binding protein [Wenzhouxiangella sp. AB-CW3]|uniref:ABC transporter ATP-binding protein n=1 Tax=Wenzhouxiangella sp. AB-CW3 TaxID=2771012 RepID=UPI00168B12DB|nr:ABC transporter ATP-binding protein [Wenzhouxiangella sp. AB-CW3]QOC23056.1 ABC transporter ATP-binding protein [Wenzhouxiangella sp. AB-CW3]
MSEVLLRLEGVTKVYPPTVQAGQRLRAFWQVLLRGSASGGTRVLEEVSFEVPRGQSMAVIGGNGAGKSTLLKIVTGVLAPTTGHIESRGSSAALLELGAGFDPEYSGLDNLRMNAAFLGLSTEQVAERLDDILAFADIGASIHEPVKHYSSGMVVRLGFAVVASVRPDLLITDEVLAVGDESFQKKCIRWIERYLADGGTLLMVSHNMYQVQKLCRNAIWLDGGQVRAQGDVFDVTQSYLAWHERKDAAERGARRNRESGTLYRVSRPEFPEHELASPVLETGQPLTVRLHLRSPDERAPAALIGVVRADGTPVYGVSSDQEGVSLQECAPGEYRIDVHFPALNLLPGGYAIRAHAMDPEGLRVHDTAEQEFSVSGRTRELGMVRLAHEWRQP